MDDVLSLCLDGMQASNPKEGMEYSRQDLSKAKLAFTSSQDGIHTLCFHNHGELHSNI